MQITRASRVRPLAALVAGLLGTAGLALGVLPSGAQESTSGQDQTTATTAPLQEGGSSSSGSSGSSQAGPRENGGRIENVARDLTLESARIESVNLNDTDQEYAVYRFRRVVHEVKSPSDFSVSGFDVDAKTTASDARLVQGDPREVLVGFPSGTDLRRYTIASVATGAVEDEAGEANIPGSQNLSGASVGSSGNSLTDGPDLLSVRPIDSLERVEYRYDEQIDEQNRGDASKFGYYTADGLRVPASSIVTAEDNIVTAQFDRQVEDGELFYAENGATKNGKGIDSSAGSIGSSTTAPDLTSVSSVIGTTQFDYTFDEPITDVDMSKFVLYTSDGTAYKATGSARPSAEVVRIAIPDIHDFSAKMVLATADDGAVKADDGSETPSTVGARRVGGLSPQVGHTSGPDLESASMDESAGQVLFTFDKDVDDDLTYEPKDFMVITPAGDLVQARSFVEVKDNTVLMNFDKNVVRSAEGVAINDGAVKDFQGEKSPAATVNT